MVKTHKFAQYLKLIVLPLLLLLFSATVIAPSRVHADADTQTIYYFGCDGVANLAAGNVNKLECSTALVGPLGSEAPGLNIKVTIVCNGPEDYLKRGPTPTYTDAEQSFTVTGCTTGTLRVATFVNIKDGTIITAKNSNTSIVSDTGCTDGERCLPSDCAKLNGQTNTACEINGNKIVTEIINPAIKIFSILVGVVAVIMLIIAGIIYSSSQDDPQKVTLAKKIIFDVVLGLVIYVFLFALLNYLLPQGLTK